SDGDIAVIRGSRFLRGRPDRGFSQVSPFPGHPTYYVWLAEISAGRFLALTDAGELQSFDGTASTQIALYPVQIRPEVSGIAGTADGEARVGSPIFWLCHDILCSPVPRSSSALEFLRDGARESVDGVRFNPTVVVHDDVLGTVIGSGQGVLVKRTGDSISAVG